MFVQIAVTNPQKENNTIFTISKPLSMLKKTELFLAILLTLPAAIIYADKYPWQPGLQLTWSDFQGSPNNSVSYTAYTSYYISYRYIWDDNGTIRCTVTCSFDQQLSWKKGNSLSDALLRHEQLHFNVAELFARKMRKAFNDYTAFHKHSANTDGELKNIYYPLLTACQQYNDLYDKETDHSRNKPKQDEWDSKIMNELHALDAYATK